MTLNLSKQFCWLGDLCEWRSLCQLQLCLLNHLQPQRVRIGIEYRGGVCRKNEPRTQLHLGPQLILRPSGISQVNVKNTRVGPSRNYLFEGAFFRNQVNPIEDVLSFFNLCRGLKKCKCGRKSDRASEIDRVGAIFRGLEIKNLRKRHIGAPVENKSDYAIFIVVNQQDHCSSEIRVAEATARDEQLSNSQILGILELNRKK